MEDKNRIDTFFSNTFEEFSNQEPDWLTPPEHIWESASQHFPRKKKRRLFLWLPLGVFGVLLVGVVWGMGTLNDAAKLINEKREYSEPIETQYKKPHVSINPEGIREDKKIEKNTVSYNNIIQTTNTAKDESKSDNVQVSPQRQNRITTINDRADLDRNIIEPKTTNMVESSLMEPIAVAQENKSIDRENTIKALNVANVKVSEIASLMTTPVSMGIQEEMTLPIMSSPIKVLPSVYRSEYGLTYRYIGVNLTDIIELEAGSKDEINSTNQYLNVNLDYRKWLNSKWSVQSGLWLTRLTSEIDFSIFSLLDRDAKEFLAQELAGFSVRDEEKNKNSLIDLRFKDNNTLEIGDEVNYKSVVSTDLYVLQLPFMIDRHYERQNWEFLLGGGFTLDFLYARQGAHELEIYKAGNLINEPFYFEEISQVALDFSIYTNMGARYKINPKLNIGLTTRIMMTDPIYSGVEAGIYYRL